MSVLGPLLFVIPVIDIEQKIIDANLGAFADDTRIWQSLNAIHTAVSTVCLRHSLPLGRRKQHDIQW